MVTGTEELARLLLCQQYRHLVPITLGRARPITSLTSPPASCRYPPSRRRDAPGVRGRARSPHRRRRAPPRPGSIAAEGRFDAVVGLPGQVAARDDDSTPKNAAGRVPCEKRAVRHARRPREGGHELRKRGSGLLVSRRRSGPQRRCLTDCLTKDRGLDRNRGWNRRPEPAFAGPCALWTCCAGVAWRSSHMPAGWPHPCQFAVGLARKSSSWVDSRGCSFPDAATITAVS